MARHEYKRKRKKARVVYPSEMCDEVYHVWFSKVVMRALEDGEEEVPEDVIALMLPPLSII